MLNPRALWLVLSLAGCGGAYSTDPPPPPPGVPPPPGGGNPAVVANVAMTSSDDQYGSSVNAFIPSSVTVVRTGTVTWTNDSGVVHNVTFTQVAGSPANIPNLSVGSVSRSFSAAGTFGYQCTNHPGMTGQVVVQ
jgi:plastocyanin